MFSSSHASCRALYISYARAQTAFMAIESAGTYRDILLILGTAGVVIPLLRKAGLSSILGFLLTGIMLGPHVFPWLANYVPFLESFKFSSATNYAGFAELGIVLLLFLIGLELSPERLMTLRHLVFGLGGSQIVLSALVIGIAALWVGYSSTQATVIGLALALSSTAIVIQMFSEDKRMGSQAGRISFGVLLMQDLAVIPMLLLVDVLAPTATGSVLAKTGLAVVQAVATGAFIVIAGRFLVTPLLRIVAAQQSTDLFMATVLFVVVGTGALAATAGLSMALGAFIAGLTLAETEFRRAIEAIIEPFKGLLLGLFFLLVGLNLDVSMLFSAWDKVLALTAGMILTKSAIIYTIASLMRLPRQSAFEAALLLGPGGEFAFVLFATASAVGILTGVEASPFLLAVTLSMVLLPLIAKLAQSLRTRVKRASMRANKVRELPPEGSEAAVLIAGFGRVGTLVADMLKENGLTYTAIDLDTDNIAAAMKAGHKVYYGDATDMEFLNRCGLARAKAVAITMDNPSRVEEIVRLVRSSQPAVRVIARARDERHAMKLYEAGVTEAVPETTEASLQLAEALLVEAGIPMGLAIASVHERRDTYRKLLGRPNRREQAAQMRSRLKNRMKQSEP
jgi:Kef-type K+ transport system membrane component KefB/voltage-gated potassium channel Kch